MTASPPEPGQYCSTLSAQAGEKLAGTASQATTWLLLEYRHAWGAKAFEESSLPQPIKEHLEQALNLLPGAKLQLISHHARAAQAGIAFFLGHSGDREPRLYEFQLDSYDALLALDFPGILAGNQPEAVCDQPLILVCTNGRRDACCARWGIPTYLAIAAAADKLGLGSEAVWQTTHVGGHRLAPNVLAFPSGLYYGRLMPQDAEQLVESCLRNEVLVERLRGRSCYPPVVQAAEYLLRQQTGRRNAEAFVCVEAVESSPDAWIVRFEETLTGRQHSLRLEVEVTAQPIQQSCGKPKTEPLVNYHLIEYGWSEGK